MRDFERYLKYLLAVTDRKEKAVYRAGGMIQVRDQGLLMGIGHTDVPKLLKIIEVISRALPSCVCPIRESQCYHCQVFSEIKGIIDGN